jgi:hypothetical protein
MNLTKSPRLAIRPTGTTVDASGFHNGFDIQVLPANPLRIGLILAQSSAAGSRYFVNFGAASQWGGSDSIVIMNGTTLILRGALPTESVHVIGILGQHYTVKEIT